MRKILLLSCVFFAGCATASGPSYTGAKPEAGKSQLVVYRANDPVAIKQMNVTINDINCKMPRNSFRALNISPGTANIHVDAFDTPGSSKGAIEAKSGQTHYIRLYYEDSFNPGAALGAIGALIGSSGSPFSVLEVSKATAESELAVAKQTLDCK